MYFALIILIFQIFYFTPECLAHYLLFISRHVSRDRSLGERAYKKA